MNVVHREDCITEGQRTSLLALYSRGFPLLPCSGCGERKLEVRPPTEAEFDEAAEVFGEAAAPVGGIQRRMLVCVECWKDYVGHQAKLTAAQLLEFSRAAEDAMNSGWDPTSGPWRPRK